MSAYANALGLFFDALYIGVGLAAVAIGFSLYVLWKKR